MIIDVSDVRDPAWYQKTGVPVTNTGEMPFARYVVRKKGVVEVGHFACAFCHTRVMPDGTVIKGAQGNLPFDRVFASFIRSGRSGSVERVRAGARFFFATPWLRPDPHAQLDRMSIEEIAAAMDAIPAGVLARQRASVFYPVQVPDLIGVKDRRYLDRSGLVLHRTEADMMRYAALDQGAGLLASHGDFRPIETLSGRFPDPAVLARYSDEQLYALAHYLYALEPPQNPNSFDSPAQHGQKIFQREGCGVCHTPPLYTNNKLIPVDGFNPPKDHFQKYDLLQIALGSDPALALRTRRGTGYYKVPSLKGVWYRGPFEHSGSVATLEDWFDPARLKDDYVPTGFVGYGVESRAVRGHEFGLRLPQEDKKALIAFLRTL